MRADQVIHILLRTAQALLVVLAGLLACVVTIAIATRLPYAAVVAITVGLGAAWAGHTDRSRELIALFFDAMKDARYPENFAAIDMGITESQLSAGKSGREQLSFSRACSLPDAVWDAYALALLERSGKYIVVAKGELADLVEAARGIRRREVA